MRPKFPVTPWFPVALMLVVLLGAWLSISVPLPEGFTEWLQKWQTLVAASVALIAAIVAFSNTTRSLRHAERLETRRRSRKHAALRAALPLALAQVQEYAEQSAGALLGYADMCREGDLPANVVTMNLSRPLPNEPLKMLVEFVEYSDTVSVAVIEGIFTAIQIHDSRIRGLVDNHKDSANTPWRINSLVVDAASIYAGVATLYRYARRETTKLPTIVSWDDVRSALRNMHLWDDRYPEVYEVLRLHEETGSAGPFERQPPILGRRSTR